MSLLSCRYFYVATFMSLFFVATFCVAKLLESVRNFVVATLYTKRVCACPKPRGWVGVCQSSTPLSIFTRLRPASTGAGSGRSLAKIERGVESGSEPREDRESGGALADTHPPKFKVHMPSVMDDEYKHIKTNYCCN